MTLSQHRWLVTVSLFALVAALAVVALASFRRYLEWRLVSDQAQLAILQEEVNRGVMSRQVSLNILQDLAPLAHSRPDLQDVLARYGVTVSSTHSSNP
jgi:hypothetical protein